MSAVIPLKFTDPEQTASGQPRAVVAPGKLQTLWINTGTLCNLACVNCYIESTPSNDRLVYIDDQEVAAYLDEIERENMGTEEIGFTGGEPFMNPYFMRMLEDSLARGYRVVVLTNAMRPMQKCADALLALQRQYGAQLQVRVSIDHYTRHLHETERGPRAWQPMLDGLRWLSQHGFNLSAAGRTQWGEDLASMRSGYRRLFASHDIAINADDENALILFPEMDEQADVPEISSSCWNILGVRPEDIMCASSRMVVKRKGDAQPVVVSCTLLPYDTQFEMGHTLAESWRPVSLNHPHCSRFCVLGGGSCSQS